jgi:hypothetical protein
MVQMHRRQLSYSDSTWPTGRISHFTYCYGYRRHTWNNSQLRRDNDELMLGNQRCPQDVLYSVHLPSYHSDIYQPSDEVFQYLPRWFLGNQISSNLRHVRRGILHPVAGVRCVGSYLQGWLVYFLLHTSLLSAKYGVQCERQASRDGW